MKIIVSELCWYLPREILILKDISKISGNKAMQTKCQAKGIIKYDNYIRW